MSNFNELLSSVGISTSDFLQASAPDSSAVSVATESPTVTNLSEEDFEDILNDLGVNDREPYEGDEDAEQHETTEETLSVDEADEILSMDTLENPVESREEPEPPIPVITPNSPTILLDDSTSRFSGTEWYNEIQKKKIILAGLGGIGSWTALQLARMNPSAITLYDSDIVELGNMSGQLFAISHVGQRKVSAVYDTLRQYTTAPSIYAISENFTQNTAPGDIMICGFDNMDARSTFYEAWKEHVCGLSSEQKKECLFIDGRLSIDTLQVICIQGDDTYNMGRYENEFLFRSYEAENTVCSMKQTTYLACMIGSFIVNVFTNWVAQSLNPIIPYDVPFFTEYSSQHMIFKTEN